MLGRHLPTSLDEPHERELAIIATKGVVQLFNTVAEFQLSQHKEAVAAQQEAKAKTTKMIEAVGTGRGHAPIVGSNERIVQAIQSRQQRWKVLEEDSEDEEGNIKVVDDQ